jgi:hypothetical protein
MHRVYGGNPRVAVGASGRTPNVFVFLKRHPRLDDLRPKLVDGLLHVPGHTQYLSTYSAENAAVLTHLRRGKALRVFDVSGPDCRYIGEFVIDLQRPLERWVDTGERYTLASAQLLAGGRDFMLKVQAPIFRLKQISVSSRPPTTRCTTRSHVSGSAFNRLVSNSAPQYAPTPPPIPGNRPEPRSRDW